MIRPHVFIYIPVQYIFPIRRPLQYRAAVLLLSPAPRNRAHASALYDITVDISDAVILFDASDLAEKEFSWRSPPFAPYLHYM